MYTDKKCPVCGSPNATLLFTHVLCVEPSCTWYSPDYKKQVDQYLKEVNIVADVEDISNRRTDPGDIV